MGTKASRTGVGWGAEVEALGWGTGVLRRGDEKAVGGGYLQQEAVQVGPRACDSRDLRPAAHQSQGSGPPDP